MNGLPAPDMIPVPASFADFYTDKDSREFTGDFWYETEFLVPEEWKGRRIALRFGCATHRAAVYVNGFMVTRHEGGFLPFTADITEVAQYNKMNRVVVLINNELSKHNTLWESSDFGEWKENVRPFFDFLSIPGLTDLSLYWLYPGIDYDYTLSYEISGSSAKVKYSVVTTGERSFAGIEGCGGRTAAQRGEGGVLNVEEAHLYG